MPSTHKSQVIQLYRSFLRTSRLFPEEPHRQFRIKPFIVSAVRDRFRRNDFKDDVEISVALKEGQNELNSLKTLCSGELEKKYALPTNSPIIQYLPSASMYTLLDSDVQDELSKTSTFGFILHRLGSMLGSSGDKGQR